MPGLIRVIAHWTVTAYKCDETSKQHYHFIYEGDGREVVGFHTPEANINIADGVYAQHTKGTNQGAIGVSCAAMLGAVSETNVGKFPIREVQFEAMCLGIAQLCKKYKIPVSPKTVLSHAEVQSTLGITQRGKWDIAVLPHVKLRGAKTCGDYMRKHVSFYLSTMK
jgi:hypothetical protein